MFARTERLLLRPGWIEDAPALVQAIGELSVARNLARVPYPYGLGDAEAFLSQPQHPVLPNCLIFTRTAGSPRLVGGIGLDRDAKGRIELGYWIARPYWGLGFATEAGRAIMAYADASLRLPQLEAGHFLDNPASAHVLRKLGFQPTGEVRARYSVAREAMVPCALFSRPAHAAGEQVEPLEALMAA
jgi:RimJ/RimL family protein N-acetyltransferase